MFRIDPPRPPRPFTGPERRRGPERRQLADRREMIRFEPDKDDRRSGADRRRNEWSAVRPR